MLNTALTVAQSGLRAAETRLASSASNIANVHSTTSRIDGETVNTPYVPTQVNQKTMFGGYAKAELVPKNPPSVSMYAPDNIAADANGITQFPNVNLTAELINTEIASYSFEANAVVLKTAKEMHGTLLDIFA